MAWVGAVLFGRDLNVIEAAEFMGLSYQLETAVLGIGSIQSDHETQHLRCDTAVVIPIAVVLQFHSGCPHGIRRSPFDVHLKVD